jgi:hypothetical protein
MALEKVTSTSAPVVLVAAETTVGGAAALVTVIVYVSCVTPSGAVTTTVMALEPTLRDIESDAEPEETVVPLTVMVELLPWLAVGVTVTLVTLLATLSV